jgi:hypothetical protein
VVERVGGMKDLEGLDRKVKSIRSNLMKTDNPNFVVSLGNSQQSFLDTLKDIQELLEKVNYQTRKYHESNALKKRMIEGDVRSKLRTLSISISTLDRVLDSVFI